MFLLSRLRISRKLLLDAIRSKKVFTPENVEFQEKILERSGLGDDTGLTDGTPSTAGPWLQAS